LGITDRDVAEAPRVALDGELPASIGRAAGEVFGAEARAPHLDGAGVGTGDPGERERVVGWASVPRGSGRKI